MLPARFSEDFSSRWAHVVYVFGRPSNDRKRCCMNPASSSFTIGYLFFYQLWGNVGGTYANDPLVSQPISKPRPLSHTAHEPQGRVHWYEDVSRQCEEDLSLLHESFLPNELHFREGSPIGKMAPIRSAMNKGDR